MDYKTAGVDLGAGDRVKQNIAALARRTHGTEVLHGPGLFGGFFQLPLHLYREPVLVSSVDGVGTKIKLACQLGRYRGLGEDIVNHCVNDIMVGGAEPLFFLDYLAFGRLQTQVVAELVEGMAEACLAAGCALIGGETAEMPDLYQAQEFDLAGTIVGVVEKAKMMDGRHIEAGDLMIGLASTGLHTNGYSLARKIVAQPGLDLEQYHDALGTTLGEALLRPHRSYHQVIRALRDFEGVRGFAHITGGGMEANTKRLLREGLVPSIAWDAWERPPLFRLLQQFGNVAEDEMQRVFNLGIGLVVVISPATVEKVQQHLLATGEAHWLIGSISRK